MGFAVKENSEEREKGRTGHETEDAECTEANICEATESAVWAESKRGGASPPDAGWSYVILLGVFVIQVTSGILALCFGVMFADFLLGQETSATETAAIYTTQYFLWSITDLLAGPLIQQFGCRLVSVVGSALSCVGMVATAFAPSASFLIFSFSILTGFGNGLPCFISYVVIPQYFHRMLGRANAVLTSGIAVGGFVGPPLLSFLQAQYGFRGATLITGALFMNTLAAAALFHPVEWHQRPVKVGVVGGEFQEAAGRRRGRLVVTMARTLAANTKLLAVPHIAMISVGGSLILGVYMSFSTILPFMMEAGGYTQAQMSWSLSVASMVNVVGRVVVSSLVDVSWFSLRWCVVVCSAVITLSQLGFLLVGGSVWAGAGVLAVFGFSMGASMSIYPLVVLHYVGQHKFVSVMGVSGLTNAVWLVALGPLVGGLRDLWGSYGSSVCLLATSSFFVILLHLYLPSVMAWEARRRESKQERDQLAAARLPDSV